MNELDPLVAAGLQLMLVGMGTVFVFLSLLVFAVRIMSGVLGRLAPAPAPALQQSSASDPSGGVPAAHVAAIVGVLEKHAKR
jgi:oxaloacetate decarboxylase gamma subunit